MIWMDHGFVKKLFKPYNPEKKRKEEVSLVGLAI